MERVKLGTVINVRGLKGEMKIASSTAFADLRYKKDQKLYLVNEELHEEKVVTVLKHSTVSIFDYVIFNEISDVDTANQYRGYVVEIDIKDVNKLEEGSYYHYELLGCEVVDEDNNHIGEVIEVMDNTAQDILRVKTNKKDMLVPFIKVFIKNVDVENKKITIHMMEGL